MAVENNRRPLVDEALYNDIRQKFALPKTDRGRLKYIGLYETKEPLLAEKFKSLSTVVASGYTADLEKVGMPSQSAKKVGDAIGREIYAIAWYGYMFAERARDITWERETRAAWEQEYKPPTYDPNETTDDSKGEPA